MNDRPEEIQSFHNKRIGRQRLSSILAIVLWVASIVLAFIIKPNTALIWLPDALLLMGFLPLLLLWNRSWVWILFGIINGAIGFFVLLLRYIPDSVFPPESVIVKQHLTEYHPYEPWVVLGILCLVYGLVLLVLRIARGLLNNIDKSRS